MPFDLSELILENELRLVKAEVVIIMRDIKEG